MKTPYIKFTAIYINSTRNCSIDYINAILRNIILQNIIILTILTYYHSKIKSYYPKILISGVNSVLNKNGYYELSLISSIIPLFYAVFTFLHHF